MSLYDEFRKDLLQYIQRRYPGLEVQEIVGMLEALQMFLIQDCHHYDHEKGHEASSS